jgi:hypothetical protein
LPFLFRPFFSCLDFKILGSFPHWWHVLLLPNQSTNLDLIAFSISSFLFVTSHYEFFLFLFLEKLFVCVNQLCHVMLWNTNHFTYIIHEIIGWEEALINYTMHSQILFWNSPWIDPMDLSGDMMTWTLIKVFLDWLSM